MFYVIELQSTDEGSALVTAYADVKEARAKYHTILSVASKSTIRKHGALLVDENGLNVEPPKVYENDQ